MTEKGRLIMVVGLPGTGKTTFSKLLSDTIGAHHLNTDKIRDQLKLRGKYDDATKQMVYSKLKEHTAILLSKGATVIVDGTLYKKRLRDAFSELVMQLELPTNWIELQAQEKVIKKRVASKRTFSEADFSVYQLIKANYEPLEGEYLVLQSDELDHVEMVVRAMKYLLER
ncbi:MAG: ATP-binding protein [Bacteroidota bacterium]